MSAARESAAPVRRASFLSGWTVLEAAAVVAAYSALSIALTWPLAAELHTRMLGPFPNDGSGTVAWLWELRHEGGYHFFGSTHHTLTGAPLGWDQGNALNFQWLWPYYPMYLLSLLVGEVAAFNLCILAGFVLSGAAMYLLVRWLGCGPLVAFWAGLVYLVFPWHLQRAIGGHASLVHLEIFPLLILAAIAWIGRPSDRRALGVALCVGGAWLTSGYFGTMALLSLIGVGAVGFWSIRKASGVHAALRKIVTLWGLSLVAGGAIAVLSILLGGSTGIALGRSAGEVGFYGAHLRDSLPAPINSPAGWVGRHLDSSITTLDYPGAERPVYPGVLTILLALAWLGVMVRGHAVPYALRRVTILLAAVTAVALVFAIPNPLTILGVHLRPMPSLLLFKVLPSFRVPTRLIALGMAALVPLAALGLSRVSSLLGRRFASPLLGLIAVVVACAFSLAELGMLPVPSNALSAPPPAYAAVGHLPEGVLAEYPLEAPNGSSNSEYLFWQRVHGRPLLNGASQYTAADAVRAMLVDPSAPGTAGALAYLGVTGIVTRPTSSPWAIAAPNPGYSPLARFGDGVRVWRVVARSAAAIAAYGKGVGEPLPSRLDAGVGFPVQGGVVQIDLYAKHTCLCRLTFGARALRGAATVRVGGRTIDIHSRREIALLVRIPPGHSILELGTPDGRRLVLGVTALTTARAGARGVVIRPRLLSS